MNWETDKKVEDWKKPFENIDKYIGEFRSLSLDFKNFKIVLD